MYNIFKFYNMFHFFFFFFIDTSDRLMHLEHKFYCRDGEFLQFFIHKLIHVISKLYHIQQYMM